MELSVHSSSAVPEAKKIHITDYLVIHILNYIHPKLYFIIYYKMDEKKQQHLRFHIASLISLNSIATLNNFESLLMSYRFRTHLAAIIN
jgi:hypothetical protein